MLAGTRKSPIFTPEGSHHEDFDALGMFHASADIEVDPEPPTGMTYREFLESITEPGLNTWLIEKFCAWLDSDCPTAGAGARSATD